MARRERVHRLGLTDPRSGPERVAAQINRVASGNRTGPVRSWDDGPDKVKKAKNYTKKKKAKK